MNKKIGLALGGGAVLGAAHIGIIKAIEERNLEVSYISGTSIGAFVGALYAFGKSCKEIEQIGLKLQWVDITSLSLSKYGLLSNDKLGELVTKHIGDKNIEEAPIPLAMVATDATSGKKVVLKKGNLAKAVMASTCIPGIFIPKEEDNKILIDGGIVENVPSKTAREMGADYVIGVDLNAQHTYPKPDNILDVILNSFHFIMKQTVSLQTQHADLLIKPDLSSFNRSDINQVQDLMQKGFEDGKEALNKIEF